MKDDNELLRLWRRGVAHLLSMGAVEVVDENREDAAAWLLGDPRPCDVADENVSYEVYTW